VTGRLSLKNLAVLAGFGGFGKNSLLLSRDFGSAFRLACFVTDADLEPEHPPATSAATASSASTPAPWGLPAKGGNLAEVDLVVRERFASLDIPAYEPRFGGNLHLMCRACQDVCPQPSKALRFQGNSVQRLTSG